MNHPQALRLTPSNSPFFRNSSPKSPTKFYKSEESGLRLKKVIGTTSATANGFDFLPSAKQFAYTAGAAAVVSTVRDDLSVSQRFFRARPSVSGSRDGALSPAPADLRSKLMGNLREQSINGSPLGASARDWSDSPIGKSVTAKDRVKAATSVALSPNGKWIAVGETGYKPRVLIFSNKGDSSEIPVSALAEHTFGVHALAFSPDSRFLASLGTVNDGFIYIWTIDDRTGAATLHSSNKCTSTINAMTWIGRGVLTVGLRYVKLWKPEEDTIMDSRNLESTSGVLTPRSRTTEYGNSILSPRQKVLPGKNILLGDLIDANFVAALPIPSSGSAIVCTESGEVCLLAESGSIQTLTHLATVGFLIATAMIETSSVLHVSGVGGRSKRFELAELQKRSPTTGRSERRSTQSIAKSQMPVNATSIVAMAKMHDTVIELDSNRGIRLTRSGDSSAEDADVASHQLAAHSDAVLGIQCLACDTLPNGSFLTFSGNGCVHVWNEQGTSVATFQIPVESSPDMYDLTNELKAISHLPKASVLVAGDRYGTLSVLDITTGLIAAQVRSHSTEVVDVVAFERSGVQLIATASRDRMVQLFSWHAQLELLQTMDEHAAAVTGLATAAGGELLLSCSTDRTVVVREAVLRLQEDPTSVVFIMLRTISLKSSPTSMCLGADDYELLVSTVDRCVGKYNIKTGQAGFNFKCSDLEGGEAATMSKILYTPSLNGNPTIIGVSSGDKSVRLYSEYGSLIARDWGHTEGITDAALLPSAENGGNDSRAQLVTVAADSTVFMWDTVSQASITKDQTTEDSEGANTPILGKITPMAPPLRKVLSFSELSRFKREKSVDEIAATSPPAVTTPTQPPSPRRLKKKPSRTSVAQPPRLEPVFRANGAQSRRESIRKRSPSPPSPKPPQADLSRNQALGMSLRSRSSENALNSHISGNTTSTTGFGSVASSTESVCRTLRAYRKKLANSSIDTMPPHILRELGTELKLTARVLGEKSQGKSLDETMMAKLLDQASDRIVDLLDERIKERVGSEVRRSSGGASPLYDEPILESPAGVQEQSEHVDALAGALEKASLQ